MKRIALTAFLPRLRPAVRPFSAGEASETRLRFKIWNDVKQIWKRSMIVKGVVAGVIGIGIPCYLLFGAGKKESLLPSFGSPEYAIIKAFEEGGGTIYSEDVNANVERSTLHQELKKVLHPEKTRQYAVIVGENGTGKSTAVRQVLSSLEFPKGSVYINCPADHKEFSRELFQIIRYDSERDIRGGIKRRVELTSNEEKAGVEQEPLATFRKFARSLLAAAETYKKTHKRPMVLVIDSADILAKEDPKFLYFLQNFAKDCADRGTLRIVFVSSDGSALPLLISQSSWSRAEAPFEIGEISDEDAVKFLCDRNVPEIIAREAVRCLTGGLFASLNTFVSNNEKGRKLEDIINEKNRKVDNSLLKLKFPPTHELFRYLTIHKRIPSNEARREMNLSEEQIDALVKCNILATHPDETLTLHDRHVAVWLKTFVK
jgi:energy-coupling factor transporter ATP-binding protein EcfA2